MNDIGRGYGIDLVKRWFMTCRNEIEKNDMNLGKGLLIQRQKSKGVEASCIKNYSYFDLD